MSTALLQFALFTALSLCFTAQKPNISDFMSINIGLFALALIQRGTAAETKQVFIYSATITRRMPM